MIGWKFGVGENGVWLFKWLLAKVAVLLAFSSGEGFGRVRTLIAAVLQVKASCFSRTVGDAGPYKLVRTKGATELLTE